MREISKNELEEYLKTVLDLEFKLYSNYSVKNKLSLFSEPHMEGENKRKEGYKQDSLLFLVISIVNITLSIYCIIVNSSSGCFCFIILSIFSFIGYYINKTKLTNEFNDTEIEKRQNERIETYNKDLAIYNKAQSVIQAIEQNDIILNEQLQKEYDKDIVFEKYRNIVAIASIYEYVVSGRCNELTGQSGAYNLYEQELRNNIIINNLETINEKLDSIKNNQYILYNELNKTNSLLSGILSIEKMDLFMKTLES